MLVLEGSWGVLQARECHWDDAGLLFTFAQALEVEFNDVKQLRGRCASEIALGKRLYEKQVLGVLTPSDCPYCHGQGKNRQQAHAVAMVVAVVVYGHRTRNSSMSCRLFSGREIGYFFSHSKPLCSHRRRTP